MTNLPAAGTALILIDLMPRLIELPLAPYTGDQVLATSLKLAGWFRAAGAPVVAVRVDRPNVAEQPPGSGFAPGVAEEGDVQIVKGTIGAFHDTGLDEALRERGVKSLVMAGIATNLGVESTARWAADLGYHLIFVEDAMTAFTSDEHEAAVRLNFPRLGDVISSDETLAG